MRTIGLLFMPAEPVAALVAGGLSLVERQVRQLRRAGADRVLITGMQPLAAFPAGAEPVSLTQLDASVADDDRVIMLARGLIVDERALTAIFAAPLPTLMVSDATRLEAQGVERLDALTFAAGVAAIGGAQVRRAARALGDWDLESTLIRLLAEDPAVARLEWTRLAEYAPARRRNVALIWSRPQSEAEAATLNDTLIAAAQKGCLDWPARFLHPAIENLLVRLLAPTRITPDMVTLATGLIGVAAAVAFAAGWLWTGLVLALITGPLDGVDGKLARTRVEFSRFGDLEHLLDKALEYGWYLCAAGYFAATMQSYLPWACAALIILPALCEAVQGEFFRRFTGIQLDDAGPVERGIRIIAGRRNTFLWTWLPFAAFGYWFEGFVVLACYSVVTTGVAQWRFYHRVAAFGRAHSATIDGNFRATGYHFLPSRIVSSK